MRTPPRTRSRWRRAASWSTAWSPRLGKKSNGSPGNSPKVVLLSGEGITVNGQDLGGAGPNQGRIRADYIIGEDPISMNIDLFARDQVTVSGPATGTIFAVGSNGGNSDRPVRRSDPGHLRGGRHQCHRQGLPGHGRRAGSDGGAISLQADGDVLLDDNAVIPAGASLEAVGDFNATGGLGEGGIINIRSFDGTIICAMARATFDPIIQRRRPTPAPSPSPTTRLPPTPPAPISMTGTV